MVRLRGIEGLRPAQAIVFDKDGVLVDFAPLWCAIAQERALHVTRLAKLGEQESGALLAMMGVPGGDIDPTGPLAVGTRVEELAIAASFLYQRGFNWLTAKEIAEQGFESAEAAVDPDAHVRPTGSLDTALSRLRELGLRLAVATSDTTANAERDLALLGILEHFEVVLGADRVPRNKPHPDMLQMACKRLGVPPEAVWMVGDGLNDLRMARAVHATAIGVTSGVTPAAALSAEADLVLRGVWELAELAEPCDEAPPSAIDPAAWYELYTDGAARGNPGPAALGAVVLGPQREVVVEVSETLGIATNNVAEYQALLRGIDAAKARGIRRLVVKADSELMIKQLKGEYAVKSDVLRPLYQEAIRALRSLEGYRLLHVRREANRHADALANQALDAQS